MLIKDICGIVIGEVKTIEEASKRAETMKNCPNVVLLGTTANMIYFGLHCPFIKGVVAKISRSKSKGNKFRKSSSPHCRECFLSSEV